MGLGKRKVFSKQKDQEKKKQGFRGKSDQWKCRVPQTDLGEKERAADLWNTDSVDARKRTNRKKGKRQGFQQRTANRGNFSKGITNSHGKCQRGSFPTKGKKGTLEKKKGGFSTIPETQKQWAPVTEKLGTVFWTLQGEKKMIRRGTKKGRKKKKKKEREKARSGAQRQQGGRG